MSRVFGVPVGTTKGPALASPGVGKGSSLTRKFVLGVVAGCFILRVDCLPSLADHFRYLASLVSNDEGRGLEYTGVEFDILLLHPCPQIPESRCHLCSFRSVERKSGNGLSNNLADVEIAGLSETRNCGD